MKAIILIAFSLLLHLLSGQSVSGSYINCTGKETCYSDYILNCTDYNDCFIDCNGQNACQYGSLYCPINAICTLNCGAVQDDCKDMKIYAQQSNSLTISCQNGPESCDTMSVYCPTNPTISPSCIIHGLTDTNANSWTKIYAVYGVNDILITGTPSEPISLYCTEDYSKSCDITQNDLTVCDSGNNICETYTKSPTTSPTIYPTVLPTTSTPTTSIPTTLTPTYNPTTFVPTTFIPTTAMPSIFNPTTYQPTTYQPTISPLSNAEVTEPKRTDVTNMEGFQNNDTGNLFTDNVYIWIIMMLLVLVTCTVCVLCIILRHNRSTKKELRIIKEKLKSIEMSPATGSDSKMNGIEIETDKNAEGTNLSRVASISSIESIGRISNAASVDDNTGITEKDNNGEDSNDEMYNDLVKPIVTVTNKDTNIGTPHSDSEIHKQSTTTGHGLYKESFTTTAGLYNV
eukprot:203243_1